MGRKSNYIRVRDVKKSKGSSTPGILKGDNCQKSPIKIQFCKDNRMYRTDPKKFAVAEEVIRNLNK